MGALSVYNFSDVSTGRTSLAEKEVLVAEARKRFADAVTQLNKRVDLSKSLVERCELIKVRIDLIQAYGNAVSFICNN